MQASDIMTDHPLCCTPSDSVRQVAKLMSEHNCGMLPVVDDIQQNRLLGVITDRDITCRVVGKESVDCCRATVQDAMTSGKLWVVHPNATVDDVIETMEEGQVRRLPVVDETNCVVGVIATADIALELDEPEDIAEVFEEISEPTHIPHA